MEDLYRDFLIWLAGFVVASTVYLLLARAVIARIRNRRRRDKEPSQSAEHGTESAGAATEPAGRNRAEPVAAVNGRRTSRARVM